MPALSSCNVKLQVFKNAQRVPRQGTRGQKTRCLAQPVSRRDLVQLGLTGSVAFLGVGLLEPATAAEKTPAFVKEISALCDDSCAADLQSKPAVTTSTGLVYRDIVEGKGASPPVGYQATVHYVAMTTDFKVFDSSLDKGMPYDIRIGASAIIPGLDEGLRSMKPGGIRRMYIPGPLAFPNGVKSAPGRPRVLPNSPVVFDVQLLYVPGLDDDDY